ncbi:iron(III) transport system permease protein [Alteribacillus persepolensis]|uniref:Iron(III) transport system permease protein n=1 Tax=Alteribacillus persepolensis TaxID=568899 RepID=A0A1G8GJI1_9BACI|nr:iron ABC transporter permease [Alteribacillus persepolensis]SDH94554.1 iron(III) transport system permease protein [Alteribacillus persepolensis]
MNEPIIPKQHEKRRNQPPFLAVYQKMFVVIAAALLVLFFIFPILRLVILSVSGESEVDLRHYQDILAEPQTWTVLQNTVVMVAGSTFLAVALGVFMAWLITYSDVRAKRFLHVLVLLPFVIPSYIVSLSWTQLMSSNGWFASVLTLLSENLEPWNLYSLGGMIFILGLSHYPLVYLFTVGVLKRIPRELEWAARSSGAGRIAVFWKVTMPIALPGIAGGGLLAFLANLDNFGIPAFLGIPANISVLSTAIYQEVVSVHADAFSRAAVLSVVLGGVAVLGTVVQWLLVRKSKQLETAREDRSPRFSLGKFRIWAESGLWTFLLFIGIVPLSAMTTTSFLRTYGLEWTWDNLTWDHYWYVLYENTNVQSALENSLLLACVTTVVVLIIGTIVAYIRINKPSPLNRAAETIITVPYALPGVVLALAMIFAWMEPIPGWNPGIYGSIWILFIAYSTRFMILQVRGSAAAFMQVGASMEEAAHVFGARGSVKWIKIMVPLILPGMLTGAFFVFLTSLTELTVSSLLWSAGHETIGVMIFNFEQAGYTTHSAALSSIVVMIFLAGFVFMMCGQTIWKKRGRKG